MVRTYKYAKEVNTVRTGDLKKKTTQKSHTCSYYQTGTKDLEYPVLSGRIPAALKQITTINNWRTQKEIC